jgi:hypothetical protein
MFFVFIFLVGVFCGSRAIWAANACGQNCSIAGDCGTSCPICEGSCVTCASIGNQTACDDLGTGASANCTWTGTTCVAVVPVPEVPASGRPLILLFLPLLIVGGIYLRRRKYRNAGNRPRG